MSRWSRRASRWIRCFQVPNGAVERTEENDRPRGYRYVEEALEAGLSRTKKIRMVR